MKELKHLSVSSVETFGQCARKWWFERIQGIKTEETDAQKEGQAGHALLENYFRTGGYPSGRVKMGKAVTAAIIKGHLPTPGPDMQVEARFDGQASRVNAVGEWIPFIPEKTLWLGGLPWDGFIDLTYRRGDVPTILDHKFKANLDDALTESQLIKTVQLPVYVLAQLRQWPDAKQWEIAHHYVARKGTDSLLRKTTVSLDAVLERKEAIEKTVEEIKGVATLTNEREVPFSRKACEAFGGCPHQSICSAYKERNLIPMTEAELDLFKEIPVLPPDAPKSKPELAVEADAPQKEMVFSPPAARAEKTGPELFNFPWPSLDAPLTRTDLADLLEQFVKLLRAG